MSQPVKRSRSETSEQLSDNQPVVRSKDFWFDDGNIVLRAEQTLFRVHGALLTRHSKIFKDMVNIAQPYASLEIEVECSSVISLSDTALDVEQLLSIFYDNVKALDKGDITYAMAAAMLRLGKKYQIDYLYQEARSAFRKDYPTSLDDWNPTIAVIPNARRGDMINLAHELSLKTVLPALYLDFISVYSLSEIIRCGNTFDEPRLALSVRETIIVGRDRLILHLQEKQRLYLKSVVRCRVPVGCRAPQTCHEQRIACFEKLPLWQLDDGSPYNLRPWEEKKDVLMCSFCNLQMRDIFYTVRTDTWAKLPMFFGLGEWEKLEDETS